MCAILVVELRKQSLTFPVLHRSDETTIESWIDHGIQRSKHIWRKDNQFSFNHTEFVVMSEE